jgi:hypothetical protein
MAEASRQRREIDEFHVVLALLACDSEHVQGVQETVFVRAEALKFDQNEDVGFDEGLAEVEEFLEKGKVREARGWWICSSHSPSP